MAAPDVTNELTGAIVISSEEGETDAVEDKVMADLGMGHNARLMCDDFLQNFELVSHYNCSVFLYFFANTAQFGCDLH